METIFDHTAQELFRMLTESSESSQIEAKSNEDMLRQGKNCKPGRMNYRTLMETIGTGIKRMRELMSKAHLAQPTFESSREKNEFTIRLLLHHFLGKEDLEWLKKFRDKKLNDTQKTALIFVRELGAIDNATFRQIGYSDTLKASKALRDMRDMDLLIGKGRGSASYYVPGPMFPGQTEIPHASGEIPQDEVERPHGEAERPHGEAERPQDEAERPHGEAERPHGEAERPHGEAERPHALTSKIPQGKAERPHGEVERPHAENDELPQVTIEDFPLELQRELEALGGYCPLENLKLLILKLCAYRPLSRQILAILLKRNESYLKKRVIRPLLETHKLRYLIPEMVKHPRQAYVTNLSSEEPEQES